ncbi:hypothetical protein HZH66_015500 [Vespula vulgaris]|uniref:Uncharacterized protein n=1 Tax=Vespula vulgaris TaxID=7454 RepID=A0A834IXW8_VESVU|nr:hypothetical protein HZH66_015500 [Vespula vulgaris]
MRKGGGNVFRRRNGTEDSFVKLRGGTGKLSVSHDSVFPGEVPHTRPLSSLDSLPALETAGERYQQETTENRFGNYDKPDKSISDESHIKEYTIEKIKTNPRTEKEKNERRQKIQKSLNSTNKRTSRSTGGASA